MLSDSEIQKILAGVEDEDYGAPIHQDKIFLIMWQSTRSGATYSDLRKSVRGKNNFLRGLDFQGFDLRQVIVVEQPKAWVPQKKSKDKTPIKPKGEIIQWHPRLEQRGHTTPQKKTQHF